MYALLRLENLYDLSVTSLLPRFLHFSLFRVAFLIHNVESFFHTDHDRTGIPVTSFSGFRAIHVEGAQIGDLITAFPFEIVWDVQPFGITTVSRKWT